MSYHSKFVQDDWVLEELEKMFKDMEMEDITVCIDEFNEYLDFLSKPLIKISKKIKTKPEIISYLSKLHNNEKINVFYLEKWINLSHEEKEELYEDKSLWYPVFLETDAPYKMRTEYDHEYYDQQNQDQQSGGKIDYKEKYFQLKKELQLLLTRL